VDKGVINPAILNTDAMMGHFGYANGKFGDAKTVRHKWVVVQAGCIAELIANYGYAIPVHRKMVEHAPSLFHFMVEGYKTCSKGKKGSRRTVFLNQEIQTNVPDVFDFLSVLLLKGMLVACFDPNAKAYYDRCATKSMGGGEFAKILEKADLLDWRKEFHPVFKLQVGSSTSHPDRQASNSRDGNTSNHQGFEDSEDLEAPSASRSKKGMALPDLVKELLCIESPVPSQSTIKCWEMTEANKDELGLGANGTIHETLLALSSKKSSEKSIAVQSSSSLDARLVKKILAAPEDIKLEVILAEGISRVAQGVKLIENHSIAKVSEGFSFEEHLSNSRKKAAKRKPVEEEEEEDDEEDGVGQFNTSKPTRPGTPTAEMKDCFYLDVAKAFVDVKQKHNMSLLRKGNLAGKDGENGKGPDPKAALKALQKEDALKSTCEDVLGCQFAEKDDEDSVMSDDSHPTEANGTILYPFEAGTKEKMDAAMIQLKEENTRLSDKVMELRQQLNRFVDTDDAVNQERLMSDNEELEKLLQKETRKCMRLETTLKSLVGGMRLEATLKSLVGGKGGDVLPPSKKESSSSGSPREHNQTMKLGKSKGLASSNSNKSHAGGREKPAKGGGLGMKGASTAIATKKRPPPASPGQECTLANNEKEDNNKDGGAVHCSNSPVVVRAPLDEVTMAAGNMASGITEPPEHEKRDTEDLPQTNLSQAFDNVALALGDNLGDNLALASGKMVDERKALFQEKGWLLDNGKLDCEKFVADVHGAVADINGRHDCSASDISSVMGGLRGMLDQELLKAALEDLPPGTRSDLPSISQVLLPGDDEESSDSDGSESSSLDGSESPRPRNRAMEHAMKIKALKLKVLFQAYAVAVAPSLRQNGQCCSEALKESDKGLLKSFLLYMCQAKKKLENRLTSPKHGGAVGTMCWGCLSGFYVHLDQQLKYPTENVGPKQMIDCLDQHLCLQIIMAKNSEDDTKKRDHECPINFSARVLVALDEEEEDLWPPPSSPSSTAMSGDHQLGSTNPVLSWIEGPPAAANEDAENLMDQDEVASKGGTGKLPPADDCESKPMSSVEEIDKLETLFPRKKIGKDRRRVHTAEGNRLNSTKRHWEKCGVMKSNSVYLMALDTCVQKHARTIASGEPDEKSPLHATTADDRIKNSMWVLALCEHWKPSRLKPTEDLSVTAWCQKIRKRAVDLGIEPKPQIPTEEPARSPQSQIPAASKPAAGSAPSQSKKPPRASLDTDEVSPKSKTLAAASASKPAASSAPSPSNKPPCKSLDADGVSPKSQIPAAAALSASGVSNKRKVTKNVSPGGSGLRHGSQHKVNQ